eukprot:6481338-Amphidinium_carterae.2
MVPRCNNKLNQVRSCSAPFNSVCCKDFHNNGVSPACFGPGECHDMSPVDNKLRQSSSGLPPCAANTALAIDGACMCPPSKPVTLAHSQLSTLWPSRQHMYRIERDSC